ncbi:MAG: hypothetical protein K2W95_15820 [Candidatus Obscuribacterales bacterium]|nr:hypothetical protein [Candidatus Obscuribacterales bacterium]
MPNRDWIVIDTKRGDYLCQRCNTRVPAPQNMMSFGMLTGMMKGFVDEHKKCKPAKKDKLIDRDSSGQPNANHQGPNSNVS